MQTTTTTSHHSLHYLMKCRPCSLDWSYIVPLPNTGWLQRQLVVMLKGYEYMVKYTDSHPQFIKCCDKLMKVIVCGRDNLTMVCYSMPNFTMTGQHSTMWHWNRKSVNFMNFGNIKKLLAKFIATQGDMMHRSMWNMVWKSWLLTIGLLFHTKLQHDQSKGEDVKQQKLKTLGIWPIKALSLQENLYIILGVYKCSPA